MNANNQTRKKRVGNGYLGHPFKNRHVEREKDLHPLLANRGGWVYNQTSLTAYSCSNNDTLI